MPNISIIIPVYNVEKYLSECLESVVQQTFSDWEAICVNDGSFDKCEDILKKYAQKILDDFYQALQELEPKAPLGSSLSPIYQNYETSFAFDDLLRIENILMDKTDHQFKYNKKDFWQEVERRKVLTKTESIALQKIVKTGNCVAHANPGAANAKIQLTDNDGAFLTNVLFKLSDFTR